MEAATQKFSKELKLELFPAPRGLLPVRQNRHYHEACPALIPGVVPNKERRYI